MRTKVAIIGTGEIGADLMMKVMIVDVALDMLQQRERA